jgi:hypothetical protein
MFSNIDDDDDEDDVYGSDDTSREGRVNIHDEDDPRRQHLVFTILIRINSLPRRRFHLISCCPTSPCVGILCQPIPLFRRDPFSEKFSSGVSISSKYFETPSDIIQCHIT